jgi:serine/threonine protein kinase
MTNNCITREELAEFALGKLDRDRTASVASHIDRCLDCQETVVAIADQSDTFVSTMRAARDGELNPHDGENALRIGIRRVVASIHQTSDSILRASLPQEMSADIQTIGPYEMVGKLGTGGMGAVYRARHTKLKRDVAIKLLPHDRWPNQGAVTRFEREMEAIGQLDHPNIVRATDAGEADGMHYLVMEYVDGLDLSRLARSVGPFSVANACELVRQAANGLQYAHQNQLIHRDIKPSNLILGAPKYSRTQGAGTPTLKILDLGLALLGEEHLHDQHELTTVGQMMGTLDYMSPEQGLDSHDVDCRTDIFSLGATLFKLLTGQAPLEAVAIATPLRKLTALATKPLPPIRTIRQDIPAALAVVVDRMLARDPEDRFSTAQEVADALQPFCAKSDLARLLQRGRAADAHRKRAGTSLSRIGLPRSAAVAARRSPIRRRWLIGALAIAVLLCGALVIYLDTGKGRIRIDARVSDVEIDIRQGDRVVDTIEVAAVGSSQSARIRAGTYEIDLKNAGDNVRLSPSKVTISRGEEPPTVTVERVAALTPEQQPAALARRTSPLDAGKPTAPEGESSVLRGSPMGIASAPNLNLSSNAVPAVLDIREIQYDGKTFTQWLSELKIERKPERMIDAVNALRRLHDHDQSQAAIQQMLESMRIYGSIVEDSSHEGQLIKAVRESLQDMPPDQVYDAMVREIAQGNRKSREFLGWFFGAWLAGQPRPVGSYIRSHPDRIGTALVEASETGDSTTRVWAVQLLTQLCQMSPEFATEDQTVLEALKKAALDPQLDRLGRLAFGTKPLRLEALDVLAQHNPDPEVIQSLLEWTRSIDPYKRLWAIQALAKAGPAAAVAIPQLMDLLRREFQADYPFVNQQNVGFGGMMGGGMGGGLGSGMGGMGGVGFGGYEPFQRAVEEFAETGSDKLIYQATVPDVRTEIVRLLAGLGEEAAPAVPDLLSILEEATRLRLEKSESGQEVHLETGIVLDMSFESNYQGGPSEVAATEFMTLCFSVIKNCRAIQAIPLLTRYVNGKEVSQEGDFSSVPWLPDAKETLKFLQASETDDPAP